MTDRHGFWGGWRNWISPHRACPGGMGFGDYDRRAPSPRSSETSAAGARGGRRGSGQTPRPPKQARWGLPNRPPQNPSRSRYGNQSRRLGKLFVGSHDRVPRDPAKPLASSTLGAFAGDFLWSVPSAFDCYPVGSARRAPRSWGTFPTCLSACGHVGNVPHVRILGPGAAA